jgi:hypothetical protein
MSDGSTVTVCTTWQDYQLVAQDQPIRKSVYDREEHFDETLRTGSETRVAFRSAKEGRKRSDSKTPIIH